jgi:N-acetylglucosamine-6-sulfatase
MESAGPARPRLLATALLVAAWTIAACSWGEAEEGAPASKGASPASSTDRGNVDQAVPPPNVLMIVTDDQPFGTVERMPALRNAPGFVRFDSFYANNPLCCPSRATLLTGLYSHHTGIETNLRPQQFDASSTLATWLDDAGYRTGLFGKYLNEYPWGRPDFVPPGWDRWTAFTPDGAYYDYTLTDGGTREELGDAPSDYSTDVLAARVDQFIRSSERPFFAYFAPYAPHAPRTPAPRHRDAFAGTSPALPPNFDRIAMEAPRWWANRAPVSAPESQQAALDQWRSLLAVDEAIARLLATLEKQGEADDTLVVFLSDNGYSLGSHRNPWKDCAYEECIHVPLLVRWPGHTRGGEIDALVSNIDIAPTIAEIAGVEAPARIDGRSLVPLLEGDERGTNRPVLLRHVKYPRVAPSFWGVRTERWTYVIYEASGERELYDLAADPYQLSNLAGQPRYAPIERRLELTIERLRDD